MTAFHKNYKKGVLCKMTSVKELAQLIDTGVMWMEPNTPKSINERMSTIWQSRFGEKKWNKNIQNSDADFRKMQCQDVGYQDGSLRWSFPNYLME